jgi:hypothetical protein
MLADRIIDILANHRSRYISYLKDRLPDVERSDIRECLKELCDYGVVETCGHARYRLTGALPHLPTASVPAQIQEPVSMPRHAGTEFIRPPSRDRLMAGR